MDSSKSGLPDRYSRHRELLRAGSWRRLASSRVVVAGAGGLGAHVLDLLVRLAPLSIEVWDPALLDDPDLNRQSLYTSSEIGRPKSELALQRLRRINPDASVEARHAAIDNTSLLGSRIGGTDVVFDCLDSFAARAALERAVERTGSGLHLIHGGVATWYGQVATLLPPQIGYADLFGPEFAKMESESNLIMPHVVAVVASLQVAEFVRLFTFDEPDGTRHGIPSTRLITFDGQRGLTSELPVRATTR